jgi:single-strand DNA-binding protein
MSDINLVVVSGIVSKAPETRTTTGGKEVTSLSIECKEVWSGGERKEFIRVVGWNEQSAQLALMAESDTVLVQGRWSSRSWEDKAGNKQRTTEVVARSVELLVSGPRALTAGLVEEEEEFDFR